MEPVSGKTSYLIRRTVSVREPETAVEENRESGDGQQEKEDGDSGEEEPATGEESVSPSDGRATLLSEGELETFSAGDTMVVRMASAPVLKAAAKSSSKDSMKVACDGYARHTVGAGWGLSISRSPGITITIWFTA